MEKYTSLEIITDKKSKDRKIPQAWQNFLIEKCKGHQQSEDEIINPSVNQIAEPESTDG